MTQDAEAVRCRCCGERYPAGTFLRWCKWCVDECTNEGCIKPSGSEQQFDGAEHG